MSDDIRILYVTTKDENEALAISQQLVTSRLAACTNIIQGMTSVYIWEGRLEKSSEAVLLIKTTAAHVDEVIAAVRQQHSYELPCVLTLPVDSGNPDYMAWLKSQVR